MPPQFSIWIVSPEDYLHSRCFEELALALSEAFTALGFDAPIVTDLKMTQGHTIVLGANLLPRMGTALPENLILYNLEQVQEGSVWIQSDYMELLKRYPVWDYSERNINALKAYGITATLCGIGYMPGLTRIVPAAEQDIDLLFIGSLSERRMQLLNRISAIGLKVSAARNVYGSERDALIARAKLVVNIHYYDAQVFEMVRVSYLLANRVCVVSEAGYDEALEAPLRHCVAFCLDDDLPEFCEQLVADDRKRAELADAGFAAITAMSQVPMLKRALAATLPGVFA